MLLIISENKDSDFEKVKSRISPKTFSKENIVYNRIRYNNSIIALGGTPVNGQFRLAYDRLYISEDNGITWKQDDEIVMPYAIQGTSQCVAAAVDSDHFLWLICGSAVWKGRLNELGFEK